MFCLSDIDWQRNLGSVDSQLPAVKALLPAGCPAWAAPALQVPHRGVCSTRWREGRQTQREPSGGGANGPGKRKMVLDQLDQSPALSNSYYSGKIKSQMRTAGGQEPAGDKGLLASGWGCELKKAMMRCSKVCPGLDSCHPSARPGTLSQAQGVGQPASAQDPGRLMRQERSPASSCQPSF